jgi:hypothetical protein
MKENLWTAQAAQEFEDAYWALDQYEQALQQHGNLAQALASAGIEFSELEKLYSFFPKRIEEFGKVQQLAKLFAQQGGPSVDAPPPPPAAASAQGRSKVIPVSAEGLVKAFEAMKHAQAGFVTEGEEYKLFMAGMHFVRTVLRNGSNPQVPVEQVRFFVEATDWIKAQMKQYVESKTMDGVELAPDAMSVPDMVQAKTQRLLVLSVSAQPPFTIGDKLSVVLDTGKLEKFLGLLTNETSLRIRIMATVNAMYVNAFKDRKTLDVYNVYFMNLPRLSGQAMEDAVYTVLSSEFSAEEIPKKLCRTMARDVWFLLSCRLNDSKEYWEQFEDFRADMKDATSRELPTLLVKKDEAQPVVRDDVVIVIDDDDVPAGAPAPARAPAPAAAPAPAGASSGGKRPAGGDPNPKPAKKGTGKR